MPWSSGAPPVIIQRGVRIDLPFLINPFVFGRYYLDAKPSLRGYMHGGFSVAVIDCRVGDDYLNMLGLVLHAWDPQSFGHLVEPALPLTDGRLNIEGTRDNVVALQISPERATTISRFGKHWTIRKLPSEDSGLPCYGLLCKIRTLRLPNSYPRLSRKCQWPSGCVHIPSNRT